MEDEKPLAKDSIWRVAFRTVPRAIARIFGPIGGIANLLGIYTFGESHNWWGLTFAISSEMRESLLMLAVGIGGPWAMMLGGIVGAKLTDLITKDRAMTIITMQSAARIGSFFALFHCSEMMFGIKIFPGYISGDGFAKVVLIYLLAGLTLGTVFPLLIHAVRRMASSVTTIGMRRVGGARPIEKR